MARVFKPKKTTGVIKVLVYIIVIAAFVLLVYWGIGTLGQSQDEEQIKIAHDAIVKATVQCYALESQYPPGLSYLEENYGLTLDKEKYVYHYRSIGQNVMPEIQIFRLDGKG
jgi:competence protein ComGC